jgi:Fe-S oxidoreductase
MAKQGLKGENLKEAFAGESQATELNLKSAIAGETVYPGVAKTARDEGFAELGEWFETLAKTEKSHAGRFTKGSGRSRTRSRRRPSRAGRVAYHVPCHLRAQNMGVKSAGVLRAIPGTEVELIERCSAVDGTWGFKQDYYELSLTLARPLFDAVAAANAAAVATDCPLAALQIVRGTGTAPRHPIQILACAYGIDDP